MSATTKINTLCQGNMTADYAISRLLHDLEALEGYACLALIDSAGLRGAAIYHAWCMADQHRAEFINYCLDLIAARQEAGEVLGVWHGWDELDREGL